MAHPKRIWMVKGDGPAVAIHHDRATAENEAKRLAGMHPGVDFYVMESVTLYRRVTVERISFDDETIPF